MTDKKYIDVASMSIGYDVDHKTIMTSIISLADRLVSSRGDLVKTVAAINDKAPADVEHQFRYWDVELVTDGWNYEALMTQQVTSGVAESRAIRQGADNDSIGYLIGMLNKVGGGTDPVIYEGGRGVLSGFSLRVSNRKGTEYQPCTTKFKVRGNRT